MKMLNFYKNWKKTVHKRKDSISKELFIKIWFSAGEAYGDEKTKVYQSSNSTEILREWQRYESGAALGSFKVEKIWW